MRLSLRTFIPFILLSLLLPACKERNDIYPPVPWSLFSYNGPEAPRPIAAILYENDHSAWYGSRGTEGILHHNGSDIIEFSPGNTGIPFDSITAIVRDGYGRLWVGYRKGLAVYQEGSWRAITEMDGRTITGLAVQGIGILWVGISGNRSRGGVARFDNTGWHYFSPELGTIASAQVTCILVDKDQRVIAGSSDKGLLIYNGSGWRTLELPFEIPRPGKINALVQDPEGVLWAGTESSCLLSISSTGSRLLFTGTSAPITSLLAGIHGKLWIGTRGAGILTLETTQWTLLNSNTTLLPDDHVLCLSWHPGNYTLAGFSNGQVAIFNP